MIHSNEECDAITPETTDVKKLSFLFPVAAITTEADDEAIDKIVVICI